MHRWMKLRRSGIDLYQTYFHRVSATKSRSNRIISTDIQEEMTGFHGRVQKEYNSHPVGKYMGPYDQNKNLSLKIQLPESNLNFKI